MNKPFAHVYEVFLPRLQKCAFVRMNIRFKNPPPEHNIKELPFVDILDILTEAGEGLTVEQLKDIRPLTYSLGFSMFPPQVKGKSKWVYIGEDTLREHEKYYPDERHTNMGPTFPNYVEKNLEWFYLNNGERKVTTSSTLFTDYNRIRHLGYLGVCNSQELMTNVITILWIRKSV
jgi:hypothetical protein